MALSMFRSFGIQEKIAGNMREKQRAVAAAVSAEVYAENWLINNSMGNNKKYRVKLTAEERQRLEGC